MKDSKRIQKNSFPFLHSVFKKILNVRDGFSNIIEISHVFKLAEQMSYCMVCNKIGFVIGTGNQNLNEYDTSNLSLS